MLHRNLLATELLELRDDFVDFDRQWRLETERYSGLLKLLDGKTSDDIRILTRGTDALGALPSKELEDSGSMIMTFGERWHTHEEARRWAIGKLRGRVTFAADGSQLLPGREISLPIAAVQVAWFENPHSLDGAYTKQARLSVVPPNELLQGNENRSSAETVISFRRFKLETEAILGFMERRKGWQERRERAPVAFFDGTFLISFARPQFEAQRGYIETIADLVNTSRLTRVPLVGFVDQSYARDLVKLLETIEGLEDDSRATSLYDAQLLRSFAGSDTGGLNMWGDRTAFCYCVRETLSKYFVDEKGAPLIGFVYLQTSGEGLPARVDVPAWIYEDGILDEVIDTVRAECVGGLGYPYAIETADDAAVISARDREHFLRMIQDFAKRECFSFSISQKTASKNRRR